MLNTADFINMPNNITLLDKDANDRMLFSVHVVGYDDFDDDISMLVMPDPFSHEYREYLPRDFQSEQPLTLHEADEYEQDMNWWIDEYDYPEMRQ